MTSRADGQPTRQVSVVGIGNVLLGDDGLGPLVIEMFRCQYECGMNVELLDLGTPGLDIAPYLYDRELVILVDAVHADAIPGTLCTYYEGEFKHSRARLHLTGHDPGIQESLAHLRLAGHAPGTLIVVGVVPRGCDFGEGISPAVLTGAEAAIDEIARLLNEYGIGCQRRYPSLQPNLWWLPHASPAHFSTRMIDSSM